MPITKKARERLHQLMEERRLELNLTWRELAARAGISYEAIRGLWTGSGGIRTLTARNLDRALEWQPGSVERLATGTGDALPIQDSAGDGERPRTLRYADPEKDALAAEIWEKNRDKQGPVFATDVLAGVVEFLWRQRQQDTGAPSGANGDSVRAAG